MAAHRGYTKEQAAQANRDNVKRWTAENPDKAKAYQVQRRATKRDQINGYLAGWRGKNRDKTKAANKKWRDKKRADGGVIITPEQRKARNEQSKEWRRANPGSTSVYNSERRAREKKVGGKFTRHDVKRIIKAQRGKCAYCKTSIEKIRHIDHIIPIILGGSNGPENIQVLCPPCNLKKSRRDPLEFAQSLGLLL